MVTIQKTHKEDIITLGYEFPNEVHFLRIYINNNGHILYLESRNLDNKTIVIDGIEIARVNRNKGYGTLAVTKLIELSRPLGYKKIIGIFPDEAFTDKEYKDRLVHFYNKLGFNVIMDELKKKAKIELNL